MKIGIIVTTHESEGTIAKTLSSIESFVSTYSPYHDFYIYVIDDNSSDGTVAVVNSLSKKFINFNNFSFESNGGVSRSRNYGINESKRCDFITFVDGDDELVVGESSEAIKKLDLSAEQDVVCFDHYISDGISSKLISHRDESTSLDATAICTYIQKFLIRPNRYSLFVTCWGKFYNTRLFNPIDGIRFKAEMHLYEDALFINKLLRKNLKIIYLKLPIYKYNNIPNKSNTSISLSDKIPINNFWSFIYPLRQLKWFLVDSNIKYSKAKFLLHHAVAAYTCISIIRICFRLRWNYTQLKFIHNEINRFICRKIVLNSFSSYDVDQAGGNKILSWLVIQKHTFLVLFFAAYIARKRYSIGNRMSKTN
jgi:glycosyltransferase involved in cell wall biosynthesis